MKRVLVMMSALGLMAACNSEADASQGDADVEATQGDEEIELNQAESEATGSRLSGLEEAMPGFVKAEPRVGNYQIEATYPLVETVDELYQSAKLVVSGRPIAKEEFDQVLEEGTRFPMTAFEFEVDEVFKDLEDNSASTVLLLQDGIETAEVLSNPLMGLNESHILFLEESSISVNEEPVYTLVEGPAGVFFAGESEGSFSSRILSLSRLELENME
ncbi:hypothetical protein FLK61_26520 [Paenalkalicoccus suaedae]|uniref:Lipoprotein n=1 Tax=Paenalkalicoccus suaedae TaxID=2592382 RepID=A0A859FDL1_9BACI|nr:hypothetical protein [Paenalkalicoccus suaedae]QKS70316.1 hypothetical protein FLK61_26520 [Paenalkalicoccus suaedae]